MCRVLRDGPDSSAHDRPFAFASLRCLSSAIVSHRLSAPHSFPSYLQTTFTTVACFRPTFPSLSFALIYLRQRLRLSQPLCLSHEPTEPSSAPFHRLSASRALSRLPTWPGSVASIQPLPSQRIRDLTKWVRSMLKYLQVNWTVQAPNRLLDISLQSHFACFIRASRTARGRVYTG